MYRWILAIYFFSWLIVSGVDSNGPKYFIFLTNWSFLAFNAYLIVAAFSSTTKYLFSMCPFGEHSFTKDEDFSIKKPQGCCGYEDNTLSWYQMIHWLLFTLGTDLALGVLVLYWALLYDGSSVSGVNANTHLLNGLVAVIELWVSGVPINILHFIYTVIFAAVYSLFTGIYFAPSGAIVYSGVLDYGTNLGGAVGAVVGVVLVFLPFVHIVIFFMQYFLKFWILYYVFGRRQQPPEVEIGGDKMV